MDVKTVCFAATQEFISLFEIRDLFMIAGTADLNRIAGTVDMNRAVRKMRGIKKWSTTHDLKVMGL
ncbi:hypothetical protein ACTQZS_12190 [Bilifractor sp. LCP19S3_H10]|uniref:hypothetical protein n=1 Tax=Bilifractor sp. LCP19S3_H10 TaxID=3438736 RepID=UPI003F9221FA